MSNRTLNRIEPYTMLKAYSIGVFPMAQSHDAEDVTWYEPKDRCIIPLDERFHISKSLKKRIKKNNYYIEINKEFDKVLYHCAAVIDNHKTREECWINLPLRHCYLSLYDAGFAHSIAVYDEYSKLQGGLFGVALGSVFFGESMFSYKNDFSKMALVYLVNHLRERNFALLDAQLMSEHLSSFGAYEIPQEDYIDLLQDYIAIKRDFI